MSFQHTIIIIFFLVAEALLPAPDVLAETPHVVRFDLPPVVEAARAVAAAPAVETSTFDPSEFELDDRTLVTVRLRLSSMIESPDVPRIDQWIVRCQPRDADISIVDYAPRTETASELATPIQVKTVEEELNSVGLSVDANYAHAARGTAGTDHSTKNINTMQFDRVAPVQAVTASGTINRGRGVYFKLRWTAQQVLEGEKTFAITMRVPSAWRGGLIDVSVTAQSDRKSFGGWDRDAKTLGAADFVVAAHRKGDSQAAALAHAVSDAEYELRSAANEHRSSEASSLPAMLRQVAMKLDFDSDEPDLSWVQRLLLNRADPHLDQEIRKLPMPIRVAVLDYVDVREKFTAISDIDSGGIYFDRNNSGRVLVAKPAQ